MKILIIGGTVFLGRHIVDAAVEAGHEVTLFNRGKHNADLFPQVEKLRGDRDGGLAALDGRSWDAAIDTCGYVPRVVAQSAAALSGAVRHYTFISSVSTYADVSYAGVDESAPLALLDDPSTEEVTGETYGGLKALCEQAAEDAMPGRVLTVRPGLIVGPHDPSDRFTYWPHRIAAGGTVVAPGDPSQVAQFIDVRDLAEWIVRMVQQGVTGVFNAAGPPRSPAMSEVLEACLTASASNASLIWVPEAELLKQGVSPWTDMPLWLGESPEYAGMNAIDVSRAVAAGLTFRPVLVTVADTLAWDKTLPVDRPLKAGLAPDRERAVLAAAGVPRI